MGSGTQLALKAGCLAVAVTMISAGIAATSYTVRAEDPTKLHYSIDIRVVLNGLRIASGNFQTTVSPDEYAVIGAVESRGVAELFERVRGRTEAHGALGENGLSPHEYVVDYVSGDKAKKTQISYSGGRISDTVNVPALRKRGDWIPLQPDHLDLAHDPLSALIVKASNLGDVCNQTIRSFDGAMRADLELRLAGMTTFEAEGYSGPAVVCHARFLPKSGYHGRRDSIAFLRDRAPITITFVPLGSSSFYSPVAARVGTPVGTFSIFAKKIVVSQL
ncbi:MAG: DUF3108 domain-containing protein [Pseudomonadota bacterium]